MPAVSLGLKNSRWPMFPKAGIQAEVLALKASLEGVKRSRENVSQVGDGSLVGCFKNRFKFLKYLKIKKNFLATALSLCYLSSLNMGVLNPYPLKYRSLVS